MNSKGVVMGVTGGIAAYKAVEVLRRISDQGVRVQVVMTDHAREFVLPLTFQTLSGRRVITGMFEPFLDAEIEHVNLRKSYDLLLIAPATANILAKFAHGIADDFLSTLYLAWNKKSLAAPSMNSEMYAHGAVQQNMEILKGRGVHFIEPDDGYLACGTVGTGRLADPAHIVQRVMFLLNAEESLRDVPILVNAGPTVEDLDPVRFLSNRSSGKMGYAVAAEAARLGAKVVLVSGPVQLDTPAGVERISVRSASEMYQATQTQFLTSEIAILTAAVCDFTPIKKMELKIKKADHPEFHLDLQPTVDILAELGKRKGHRLLVGFAAETDQLLENAEKKLREKNADLICANDVTGSDCGIESDQNQITVLRSDGMRIDIPKASKQEVARQLMDLIRSLWKQKEGKG